MYVDMFLLTSLTAIEVSFYILISADCDEFSIGIEWNCWHGTDLYKRYDNSVNCVTYTTRELTA